MWWYFIRSSCSEVFCKKGALNNFIKLTGKHMCQSHFFNNRPPACNFIKKGTLAQVLSCEFCKIFKKTFFKEHLWANASVLFYFFNLRLVGAKFIQTLLQLKDAGCFFRDTISTTANIFQPNCCQPKVLNQPTWMSLDVLPGRHLAALSVLSQYPLES